MKKLLIIIALLFLICLAGCVHKKTYYDVDFIYMYKPNQSKSVYYLIGLTDDGKEKSHLVVPNKYKGKSVYISSKTYVSRGIVTFESDSLKKVYISNEVNDLYNFSVLGNVKVFCISNDVESYPSASQKYISLKKYNETAQKEIQNEHLCYANLSYKYNYDGSKNTGYYFIDYYENEVIDFIPDDPIRDGFKFLGWYKEEECINEWNFKEDIVPYDEKVISETILYAKWEKE